MKKTLSTIFTAIVIILMGLACAVNTDAAPRYVKNISDITMDHRYVLEAADFPKSSTTKIGGRVAAPDANGWMTLIKYDAKTAEKKHAVWWLDNREQQLIDGIFYSVVAPTYSIGNTDPLPYWSNENMGRVVTYTANGFYRQSEIYGSFDPCYEHFSSPCQRWTIKKVRTDANGRAVFRFYTAPGARSKPIAMAAGGYSDFYIMIV